MADAETTVEITEPEVKTEKAPSREELKDKGWSAKELDSAEKHGMIEKKEDKAEVKNVPEKPVFKPEEKKEEPKQPETTKNGTLPDFTFKTPEQEKAFTDAFGTGTPQRAMYFRMKNERHARQAAEARAKEFETRLAAMESTRKQETPAQETDENGNVVDPNDKPLTMKSLFEFQKKQSEEIDKQNKEINEKAMRVTEAQKTQEEYARAIYPDFDDTVKKAAMVMQDLESFVPEKWKQAKVLKLIRDLQITAANAHELGIDDYNAAMIAYEIGQFHPEFGKTNGEKSEHNGKSERPEKANGGLTPEQMKRIEENTQRRTSSASIPGGGGKRTVSVDDIGLSELNKMTTEQRRSFRDKHPDRYAKLLRG